MWLARLLFVGMMAAACSSCSREESARRSSGLAAAAPPSATDTGPSLGRAAPGDTLPCALGAAASQIAELEITVRARPEDSVSAPVYLHLGRLKNAYAGHLTRGSPDECHALNRPEEFRYDEAGEAYLYTGYHFRQVLDRFPGTAVADSAAWELASVATGGDCEGYVPCEISRAYDPVAEFLQLRARSPFAAEAVGRANKAFTIPLARIPDLVLSSEQFPAGVVQGLLGQYEALAERLPLALRASATVTIADLWARFRRVDRARTLYQWLLAVAPAGIDTASVRQRLLALPP